MSAPRGDRRSDPRFGRARRCLALEPPIIEAGSGSQGNISVDISAGKKAAKLDSVPLRFLFLLVIYEIFDDLQQKFRIVYNLGKCIVYCYLSLGCVKYSIVYIRSTSNKLFPTLWDNFSYQKTYIFFSNHTNLG